MCYNNDVLENFVLKRFITSLRQPKQLVQYLNDSRGVVFLYMMVLSLIVFLPSLLIYQLQGVITNNQYSVLYEDVENEMFLKDNVLENGIFILNDPVDFTHEVFRVSNQTILSYHIQITLLENGMSMHFSNQEIAFLSYDDAITVDFNDSSIQNVSLFTRYLENFIETSPMISFIYIFSIFLSNIFDYLLVTLFLTLLMSFSLYKSQMPFKQKFKIGLYLSSIYLIFNMITILFNIQFLQFFSLLITYFYYVSFYKALKRGTMRGQV